MKVYHCTALCVALAPLVFTPTASADFQYQETTQITGGSAVSMMKMAATFSKSARQASEPIMSSVMVKGNRMARISKDSTEITDLDKETITTIDNVKHEYSVITFEQMRQQMEKAMHDAQQRQPHAKTDAAQPAPNTEMTFDVHVRKTGMSKEVSGVKADEAIMTMTMQAKDKTSGQTGGLAITNDMWMAQEIPGYEEIRDFEMRYALKIGTVFSGGMNPALLAMNPGMGQGMASMVKEMSKLKGIPVQQVTRTGMSANGQPIPAASEAPLPPDNSPQMPAAGDVAQQTATSMALNKLTNLGPLGSFSRFGKKKKEDPPPAPPPQAGGQPNAAQAAAASVLIESTTQYTTLSSAPIDPSRFNVPAGYKQIERK